MRKLNKIEKVLSLLELSKKFRNRRYLTGMDWIVHGLDQMTKQATGAGNMSQIVLELAGHLDENRLKNSLEQLIHKYPVVSGHAARAFNLAPYWKIPSKKKIVRIPFNFYIINAGAKKSEITRLLEQSVNTPFNSEKEHLAFYLIKTEKKSFLSMTFDHRLLDGRGAEAFLGLLQDEWNSNFNLVADISIAEPSHLSHWLQKFKAGQNVNRLLLRIAENAPPLVLPLAPALKYPDFKFSLISFSKDESDEIIKKANKKAGYLMLMPFLLAVSVLSMHRIFSARGITGADYVVSIGIDMRSPEMVEKQIFFNNLSFFMLKISAYKSDDLTFILNSIKSQIYDQVRSGMLKDFIEAAMLLRITPLALLSRLISLPLKGSISSFGFSYLGETAFKSNKFMGQEVINLTHMPRVPVPPGIGIFFQKFRGKFNAVLSYKQELLSDDEANLILLTLKSVL